MKTDVFIIYLLVTAGVTYLVRAIPLLLCKKEIKNRFLLSVLYYMPYSILTVMTVPAIFYATSSPTTAVAGFIVSVYFAYREKSLLQVSCAACAAVLIVELLIP